MMTHDEMIAVIQHRKNGGTVQGLLGDEWMDLCDSSISWNFRENTYRIKPEPRSLWVVRDGDGEMYDACEKNEDATAYIENENNHGWTITEYKEVLP